MISPKQTSALIFTMEECGELVRACSKVYRREIDDKSLSQLTEEAGDVYCMLQLLVEHNLLSWPAVIERSKIKKAKTVI